MKGNCPDPSEFDRILGLEKADPRRMHLEECPRCRMILESQSAFEAQPELSDEENIRCQDADLKMTAFLQDSLFPSEDEGESSPGGFSSQHPGQNQGQPSPGSKVGNLFNSVRQSPFGWPGAMAAVLICVLGLWSIKPNQVSQSQFPETIQTATTRHGGENKLPLGFSSPQVQEDDQGALTLQWAALEGAETYQIIFWSDSLEIIQTISNGNETSAHFNNSSFPVPAGSHFFCVVALKNKMEIDRSDIVGLH